MGRTFDGVLKDAGGVTTGFDYLRLGLSLYVLCAHCLSIPHSPASALLWDSAFGPIHRSVLPMFFALSGFLVAASYARNTTTRFVLLRALRIVPALAVETTLCALVIGITFTTLPLSNYFQSSEFYAYFLNIVGDPHYTLPGVFNGLAINTQLWTLPYEFECYASLVLLSLLRLSGRRDLILVLVLSVCAVMTAAAVSRDLIENGPAAPHTVFALSFLGGVILFMYRDKIPLRLDLFLACAAASYVLLGVKNLAFLSPLPVAYVTAYIGLQRWPKPPIGDVSYGIYLFHSPLLCCIYWLSGQSASPLTLFLLGLPASLAFASLSWSLVESPLLRRKSAIVGGAERFFGRISSGLTPPRSRKTPA
jgi:peptidoglycan/LPS O-acetylase OafA/YrhL